MAFGWELWLDLYENGDGDWNVNAELGWPYCERVDENEDYVCMKGEEVLLV